MNKINKNKKKTPIPKKKKSSRGKDKKGNLKKNLKEDHSYEIDSEDIMGESEIEENKEFIKGIKIFEKENKRTIIVNVFNFIGKPKIAKIKDSDVNKLNREYKNLISLLEENKIIVHFQNEYPVKEKYRFIIEDIFSQDIENIKNTQLHINFIYEEFYPELLLNEEDEF